MRIPLTKYGWPQVVIYPAIVLAAMLIVALSAIFFMPIWTVICLITILGIILIIMLSFFRDPARICPVDNNLLLSPADGKVTDIKIVQENSFIGGAALRISIFLSIFNVHINRSPCNVKVEKITHKTGQYKNALNPQSSMINESNQIDLIRTDNPKDKLIVRQISGAIARRIVCRTAVGQELAGGEQFGMIKFGSRTELYIAVDSSNCVSLKARYPEQDDTGQSQCKISCLVQIGDKVKAGLTALARFE
jgi:phosphatidylserine decarboxylase